MHDNDILSQLYTTAQLQQKFASCNMAFKVKYYLIILKQFS